MVHDRPLRILTDLAHVNLPAARPQDRIIRPDCYDIVPCVLCGDHHEGGMPHREHDGRQVFVCDACSAAIGADDLDHVQNLIDDRSKKVVSLFLGTTVD